MPSEIVQLVNAAAVIGRMVMPNSNDLPSEVTRDEMLIFFDNVIAQQHLAENVQHADIQQVMNDIKKYFDDLTKDKDKLIQEEQSAASLNFLAAAGSAFSSVLNAVPGLGLFVSAVSAAELATALALEVEAEKLQNTIVERLSNANGNLAKYNSLEKVSGYTNALVSNIKFYPRLGIAMTYSFLDAFFQGTVVAIESMNDRKCTRNDLVDFFINIAKASETQVESMSILGKVKDALEQIHSLSQEDADKVEGIVDSVTNDMATSPSNIGGHVVTGLMIVVTTGYAIKFGIGMHHQKIMNRAISEGAYVRYEDKVKGSWLKNNRWGVAAGAAMTITAVVALAAQVTAIHTADLQFSIAIAKARLSLTQYYAAIIGGIKHGGTGVIFAQKESVAHLLDKDIGITLFDTKEHVEIENDCTDDGTPLQLWDRDPKSEKKVRWRLSCAGHDSDGVNQYRLYNSALKKYLSVDTTKGDAYVRTSTKPFSFYITHKPGKPCQFWSEKGLLIGTENLAKGNSAKLIVCPWDGKIDAQQHWLLTAV